MSEKARGGALILRHTEYVKLLKCPWHHDLRTVVGLFGGEEYGSDAGGLESKQGASAADAYAGECDRLSGFASC